MYNLRYHLASLVAVFLALTVGLVLGSVVAERGTLGDQSSTLADSLQKQFDQIQKDNADMRAGLERDRAFATDVVPVLTAGSLKGQTIAILVNTGRTSGLNATIAAVKQAGGTPLVLTFESANAGLETKIPEALPGLLGEKFAGQSIAPAGQPFVDAVAEAVATELLSAGNRPVLAELTKVGAVKVGDANARDFIKACIVMSMFDGEPDPFALSVARVLGAQKVIVVGAEAAALKTGVALNSVDEGFSAVDDVDSPQGTFSLIWLVSGRASGYFGVGPNAEALYPALNITPN
ncbi:MAG: copper transporter [Actinomycetota bacterium]|nr:MAG: hypothetical protein FD171_810 [Actinomycetota bacterium]MDO8949348.1 copper transporter [Actinomycetota bacterium]MDP3630078.1 copper transporter [Actinomycetota bacterium]